MGGKSRQKISARELRLREQARRQRSKLLRRLALVAGGVLAVIIVAGGVLLLFGSTSSAAGCTGSDTSTCTPNSGSLSNPGSPTGTTIDGVECGSTEQLTYHVHAHLKIYIEGKRSVVPAGIGIQPPRQSVDQTPNNPLTVFVEGGNCFYWLHTHDTSGIIHQEAPGPTIFTLGQIFDVWGEQLSPNRIGPYTGKIWVFRNGTLFTGDPRNVTLGAHTVIQIDLGIEVPYQSYTFPAGL